MANRYTNLVKIIYHEVLVGKSKDQTFWVLSGFLPAFIVARTIVHFSPGAFLNVHGSHVHHFTYGIVIMAVTGYLAVIRSTKSPAWLAFLFGVGLALAVDETGMWLHLTSQYYNETSENTIVIVMALLINLVYFREFWIKLGKGIFHQLKRI